MYLETFREAVHDLDWMFVTHWLNTTTFPSDPVGEAELQSLVVLAAKSFKRAGHNAVLEQRLRKYISADLMDPSKHVSKPLPRIHEFDFGDLASSCKQKSQGI